MAKLRVLVLCFVYLQITLICSLCFQIVCYVFGVNYTIYLDWFCKSIYLKNHNIPFYCLCLSCPLGGLHDIHQWMLCDGFTSINTMHTPLSAQIIKSIIMHNFKIKSFNDPPRIGSKCFARMGNKCVPCLWS